MGKVIWRGWATDEQAANAPQPIGIIYGKNLRQSSMEEEEASTAADTLLDFYATWIGGPDGVSETPPGSSRSAKPRRK